MSPHTLSFRAWHRTSPLLQMRLWHLAVLVALVAIAIADIQDHGRKEPALILLASVGYAAFGLSCWLCWHAARRFESRLGPVVLAAVYTSAMGGLFLAATVAYLLVEYFYLGGKVR
jgi:hypothetical protein